MQLGFVPVSCFIGKLGTTLFKLLCIEFNELDESLFEDYSNKERLNRKVNG